MTEPTATDDRSVVLFGWLAIALVDVALAAQRTLPFTPFVRWFTAVGYDVAGLFVIGVAWTIVVTVLRRARLRGVRRYAALALVAALALYAPLRADLSGVARALPRRLPYSVAIVSVAIGTSLALPVAEMLGRFLGRRRPTFALAIAGSAGGEVAMGLLYPEGYTGLHLLGTASFVILIGAAISASPVARRLGSAAKLTAKRSAIVLASVGVASALVWSHRPAGATAAVIGHLPTAVFAPYARRIWSERPFATRVPDEQRAWFEPRDGLPDLVPGSTIAHPEPIIVLLGVDSMRADVLTTEGYRSRLPELFRLRDEAVSFDSARAPGSSTAPSIASMFAGVYYSQLYWSRTAGRDDLPFPWEDKTPRFPEALQAAGVRTITFDGAGWLVNHFGVVRGFDEETTVRPTYAPATALESLAEARLQRSAVTTPTFLFVHFLDAHFPYSHGAGERFERYLAGLSFVDAQIGKLRSALEQNGLWERTILIVYADHGEAFGEHGLETHGVSLYDELVHVPLLIRIPAHDAAVVHEPVSLIDIGPTILDLMGVPIPGHEMGESLVPFLRGEHPLLARPLIAEARLKRSLVMSDGIKVIDDTRNRGVEMFDLVADPGETRNLYDEANPDAARRYETLRTFFDVQTVKRPGYEVPYRQW